MKKIAYVLICVIFLSGCGKEIDDMAYVVAIGIDKAESDAFEFTFAIGNPNSINSDSGDDNNVLIFETAAGDSIFTAGKQISDKIGQEINFSHAELLLFSSEAAAGGVEEFIDSLTRNLAQRPKLIPAVALGNAKDTLESIKSQFEGNPEKYLKKLFESKDAFKHQYIDSRDFLCRTKNKDGGMAVPCISGGDSIKSESMSVFYGDKAIGAFDDKTAYALAEGVAKNISYDTPDGTLILNQRTTPIMDVKCDNQPVISLVIVLDGSVASIDKGDKKEALYKATEKELKSRIESLLKYCSQDVGVDIFGFDKIARGCFLTWDEWQQYNWCEKFKNACFDVELKINHEKTGLIFK